MWIDIWQLELLNSFLKDLWARRRALYTVFTRSCQLAMALPQLQSYNSASGTPSAVSLPWFLSCHECAAAPVHRCSLFAIHQLSHGCCHLPVHSGILDCRISHAHEIVTGYGSEDNMGGYLWLELDDTQQTGISVGQDAKSVLADSSAAASFVLVDPFWHLQAQSAIRLHHVGAQRQGGVTNKEIGSISIVIRQLGIQ